MAFKDKIGVGGCAVASGTAFLGDKVGCLPVFENLKDGIFKKKSLKPAPNVEFDTDFIQKEIQKGNIFVFPSDVIYSTNGGENEIETNTSGKQSLKSKGLIDFGVKFESKHQHFYNELTKLESMDMWEFIPVDNKGTILFVDEKIKGLKVGMVTVDAQKFGIDGGNKGSKTVKFQLTDRDEVDNGLVPLIKESHGIDLDELTGINPIYLEVVGAGVGTSVNVKLTMVDRKSKLKNVVKEQVVLLVDGVEAPATAIADTPDGYTLTVGTALTVGQKVIARTKDVALDTLAINVDGDIYAGRSKEVVVA